MRWIGFMLVVLFLSVGARPARAGAWLQEPGSAYLRLSTGILSTQERFDASGNRAPADNAGGGFRNTTYEDWTTSLYAEVGLHPRWNVVMGVLWKHLRALQPSAEFTTFGPGDLRVGIKRGLWRGASGAASVTAMLTLPTGYDPAEYPALGSDVTEAGATGELGLAGGGFWGNLEAGILFRGGGFGSQVLASLGGGVSPVPRVGVRAEVRSAVALRTRNTGEESINFDPTAVDPTVVDLAATVSVRAGSGLAVEAEVRGPVYGENTLAGTRWSLALATSPAWRWSSRDASP